MTLHENHKRYHPERPSRIMAIYTHLEKTKLLDELEPVDCPMIDIKLVERVHSEFHIKDLNETQYDPKSLLRGK